LDSAKKVLLIYSEHPDFAKRADRGRACDTLKNGHFSQDLALAGHSQPGRLPVLFQQDLDLTLLDDIQAIADITLTNDDVTILVGLS